MQLDDEIAATIRDLHEPGFNASLAALFEAAARPDNQIYLVYSGSNTPQILFSQSAGPAVFAQMETTYLPGAYRLDPYFDLHLARAPDRAYRLSDIAPDAFQRSRYFIEYYETTTLLDEIVFHCRLSRDVTVNLCLGRDTSSGQKFSVAEVSACQSLASVVSALAQRHWHELPGAVPTSEDTVDLLVRATRARHGVSLTTRQAEVALLILRGHSSVSIGLRLEISPKTVKVFRRQLYERCNICSQAELFALMMPILTDHSKSLSM
jgi:DNA-binding CsgD family transcriptional regulator